MKNIVLTNNSKVFIIGLDGATFDIIHPLIEKGKLRNIAKLMKNGSWGKLKSTIPPISPAAWTSFATGKNPGKHGIFDFLRRELNSYDMRFNNASTRGTEPIWNLLSEAGKKVGVINVTMSYPPDKVNGLMISGMDTPTDKSPFTYPYGLYEEIKEKFGKYIFNAVGGPPENFDSNKDNFIKTSYEEIQYRLNITEYLMGKDPWDFFVTVFLASDGISHYFWKYMDVNHPDYDPKTARKYGTVVYNTYEKLDDAVGRLLSALDEDTTVIIVSDHGFGAIHKVFYINQWLCDKGYLNFTGKTDCRRFCKVLSQVKRELRKFLPEKVLEKRNELARSKRKSNIIDSLSNIKWEETEAFSEGTSGGIWINLKGREPEGVIKPGSMYEQVRRQLIVGLMELKDPENDDSVVRNVYKREQVFNGSYLDRAPDLFVELNDGYSCAGKMNKDLVRIEPKGDCLCELNNWSGNHRLDGVLITRGPLIKKSGEIKGAEIIDIAPTVLYLMGLPVPKDMDGKVLREIIDDDYVNMNPITFTEDTKVDYRKDNNYSQDDEKRIEEMLRSLGYLA